MLTILIFCDYYNLALI